MEAILRPLTEDNIADILANSDRYLATLANHHRSSLGEIFNAYDLTDPRQFVGGGQLYRDRNTLKICHLGWWVVAAKRQQGYGKSIARALEAQAEDYFPDFQQFELRINQRNTPSIALARSMGYSALCIEDTDLLIFNKPRPYRG